MPIRVALHHRTRYAYDKPVQLAPQVVRLRPAPHCRTPVLSYSLKVAPEKHFVNWQQDPHGNFLARLVFLEKTRELSVTVDLVAEMTVINPFAFFLQDEALEYPFRYEEAVRTDLLPYLETLPRGPRLQEFLAGIPRQSKKTVDFLVDLNQYVHHAVKYVIRKEPGVQTCEETLALGSGSCRDSAWLLVQVLRNLGLAARFVSGYLIQLKPDMKPLDGPPGPGSDFTDLHAWAEVYLPGAGWVGLDRDLRPVGGRRPPAAGRHAESRFRRAHFRRRWSRARASSLSTCRSPAWPTPRASPSRIPKSNGPPWSSSAMRSMPAWTPSTSASRWAANRPSCRSTTWRAPSGT